jgi:hypothetical protein
VITIRWASGLILALCLYIHWTGVRDWTLAALTLTLALIYLFTFRTRQEPPMEPTPEQRAYESTRTSLLAAGATLAAMVENSTNVDPRIAQTLAIYKEADAQHDAAFEALIAPERARLAGAGQ